MSKISKSILNVNPKLFYSQLLLFLILISKDLYKVRISDQISDTY